MKENDLAAMRSVEAELERGARIRQREDRVRHIQSSTSLVIPAPGRSEAFLDEIHRRRAAASRKRS